MDGDAGALREGPDQRRATAAPPESRVRTPSSRRARSGTDRQWANTGGATGTTVTASSSMTASEPSTSKPSTSTSRRRLPQHLSEHGVEPVDVEQRQHPETRRRRGRSWGGRPPRPARCSPSVPCAEHRARGAGPTCRTCRAAPPALPRPPTRAGDRLGGEQVGVGRLTRLGQPSDDHDARHGRSTAELLVGAHEGVLQPGDRLPDRR